MGWGDIFSDPGLINTVSTVFSGGGKPTPLNFADLLTGGAQAYNLAQTAGQSSRAKSDYEAALRAQKTSGAQLSKTASQMMAEDAQLRQSLLSQTGEIGSRLRSVYSQMGDIPAVSTETIAADYGALRARSMDDFAGLVKSFTSKQEAQNTTQLGGARNPGMENYQLNENLKQFAPIQQGLDNAAYAEAVKRSSDQSNALSTNRNQILQNIVSTLSPQLTAESGLYQPGVSANLAAQGAGVGGQYLAAAAPREQVLAKQSQTEMGNLNATIAKIFGTGPAPSTQAPAATTVPTAPSTSATPAPAPSVFPTTNYTPIPGQTTKPWWDLGNQTYAPR